MVACHTCICGFCCIDMLHVMDDDDNLGGGFYCSHATQRSQWNHPEFDDVFAKLSEFVFMGSVFLF